MQTINKQTLTLDLVTNTTATLPKFTQYDTNILEFTIKESGVNADLSNVSRIAVNVKRPDGIIISRLLTNTDNVVTYEFGQEEQQIIGIAELIIQFFDNNDDRISTKRVEVKFTESFEPTLEQPEQLQLLETLFAEVDTQLLLMENAETIRVSNESTRQAQEATRQADTTTAINNLNAVKNANVNVYKIPVANFAAIATTYPTPSLGWKVQTTDNGKIYRYDGSTWVFVEEMNNAILTDIQIQVNDANRQSTTLSHGVSIVNAPVDGPVDFNVEGRTLTSLGNSNLNGDKYHVLSGKNYKVKVDNTTYTGVTKFQKKSTLTSKADFVGKVAGSTVENPHEVKHNNGTSATGLLAPNAGAGWLQGASISGATYTAISSLNSTTSSPSNSNNGAYAQILFSFSLIDHIERTMGRIPKTTVADKVAWLKANLSTFTIQWYGMGSSVGGNGATLSIWRNDNSTWTTVGSHTNATVTKIGYLATQGNGFVNLGIDANGYVHFLAYTTNPSNGSIASSISTDFVDLQVDLLTTAVLDTRPIVIRVEDFATKVDGNSTVENPHIFKWNNATTLENPTMGTIYGGASNYTQIGTLNGTVNTFTVTSLNAMAKHQFSFDIIQAIERNVGRIPKATLAEKVQWVKDGNVANIKVDWNGFGSSVGGNKASLSVWKVSTSAWVNTTNHTSASVSLLSRSLSSIADNIDSNGVFHAIVYADASDGVVASTINTDFISCEIELKPEAILHDPSVPLYEVDGTTEYPNILVTWDENTVLSRYPRVQGSKPLDGLAVIAEGENLLPPFSEWIQGHQNMKIEPYKVSDVTVQNWDLLAYTVNVIPNQIYKFKLNYYGRVKIDLISSGGVVTSFYSDTSHRSYITGRSFEINPLSNVKIKFTLYNSTVETAVFFENPMLSVGNTDRPFVPRNPSTLFAPVKLGQIGDKKDTLSRQDGVTLLRKEIERVDLDGVSNVVTQRANRTGFKEVTFPHPSFNAESRLLKYNGNLLKYVVEDPFTSTDLYRYSVGMLGLVMSISNNDTGFGETYAPLGDEWKAYFNGWQAKTVDGNGKPTAWRSLGDGTDAPTQTLAYVKDNKAPNFTPYKLSYVRASASTENVSHLVEGDLVVSGATQTLVDSGYIFREKIVPQYYAPYTQYYINDSVYGTNASNLKAKPDKIYKVYKNGLEDKKAIISYDSGGNNGKARVIIKQADFDSTAIYEISYSVADRHLFTVNALSVKATYPGNIRGALDDMVVKQSDLASRMSVHDFYLYKLLLGAKNAGWNI